MRLLSFFAATVIVAVGFAALISNTSGSAKMANASGGPEISDVKSFLEDVKGKLSNSNDQFSFQAELIAPARKAVLIIRPKIDGILLNDARHVEAVTEGYLNSGCADFSKSPLAEHDWKLVLAIELAADGTYHKIELSDDVCRLHIAES